MLKRLIRIEKVEIDLSSEGLLTERSLEMLRKSRVVVCRSGLVVAREVAHSEFAGGQSGCESCLSPPVKASAEGPLKLSRSFLKQTLTTTLLTNGTNPSDTSDGWSTHYGIG